MAGPSQSRVDTQFVHFFTRKRSTVTLPAGSLIIEKNRAHRPLDTKSVYLQSVEMIA